MKPALSLTTAPISRLTLRIAIPASAGSKITVNHVIPVSSKTYTVRKMKITAAIFLLIMSTGFAVEQTYPPHANVVDVTQPPYSAKGDG